MKHCFIIGAKGISFYGGYESFLQKLLEYQQNNRNIKYHIACKANGEGCMKLEKLEGNIQIINNHFEYLDADCFLVKIPENLKSAQAVYYDVKSLKVTCKYIEKNNIQNAVVYVLACRIGPFFNKFVKQIHKLGGHVYVNPDGHEWMRAKWNRWIRKYWKISERLMVKYADLLICDSKNIEKYIKQSYSKYHPKTTYIAYGAETRRSILKDDDDVLVKWYEKNGLKKNDYYLVVGRFVPENNYETMLKEFIRSGSNKKLAIVSNVNEKFLNELEEKTHFSKDPRVKFVGTVYDKELITKIRENAFAYFHGHEVGGTNPSLLEALGATRLNMLLDVGFNREVAEDGALYWTKEDGSLSRLIKQAEQMSEEEIEHISKLAKERIESEYTWKFISDEYEKILLG